MLPMVGLPALNIFPAIQRSFWQFLWPIHPRYPRENILLVDSSNLEDFGDPFVRRDAHAQIPLVLDGVGVRHVDELTARVAGVVHCATGVSTANPPSAGGKEARLTPEALVAFCFGPLLRWNDSVVHIQLLPTFELSS